MKKIIAAAAVALSCLAANANPQPVQIVWPFAPGSTQAVMFRNLIESANQQQSKYQFVFVNRPGAGGAIAANYTTAANSLTVLASTSSFYTRPLMYNESHDPEQFRLASAICLQSPLAMFSRKYSSFNDLKNNTVTVGINPGSVTQLFTRLLVQHNPELKFTDVPYKGTPEATTDMLGRHIDTSIDLLSVGNLARLAPDTAVIGISGTRNLANMPSFSSLKVKGLDNLTNNYYVFVPRSVDIATTQELSRIFNSAINEAVRESCNNERGVVEIVPFDRAEKLHQTNQAQWRQITQGIAKQ
jgi:tripartite-type tricarboxylate transporter receptor subunit TctC